MSVLQASDLLSSQPLPHSWQAVHTNFTCLNFKEPLELKPAHLKICALSPSAMHFAGKELIFKFFFFFCSHVFYSVLLLLTVFPWLYNQLFLDTKGVNQDH